MKKAIYLFVILIIASIIVSSCAPPQCSAYGEKQRYQRNPSYWAK